TRSQFCPAGAPERRACAIPSSNGRWTPRLPKPRCGAMISLRILPIGLLLAAMLPLVLPSPAAAENFSIGQIEVDNPWTRATPRGSPVAGAYLTIVNKGTAPDRLIGGSMVGAAQFQVHQMIEEGGVAKMRPVDGGLEIKPGQTVELKPSS